MALTRAAKTDKVKKLASDLESSSSAIIGTFSGLTASKDFELRKAVRGAGGSYHVVKNKLAARAGEGTKIEAALKGLKGKQGPSMVLAMSLPGKIILVESWPDRSAHEVFVRSTLTDALLGLGLNPPQHVTMLRLTESTVHTGATA